MSLKSILIQTFLTSLGFFLFCELYIWSSTSENTIDVAIGWAWANGLTALISGGLLLLMKLLR